MQFDRIRLITLLAFPLLAFAEALIYSRFSKRKYPWKQSLSSVSLAVGHSYIQIIVVWVATPLYQMAYAVRVWTFPGDIVLQSLFAFIGVEFLYYWWHRFNHETRIGWASHSVHHSPTRIVLAASYQLEWTNLITGPWMFWLPLVWLGLRPDVVFGVVTANALYQFWLHTELIPHLGWFESVFNTPSSHRVHHARQPIYINKNYGGTLILFDRLFRTYQPEKNNEPCEYGLVHPVESLNPFKIVVHEWRRLFKEVCRTHGTLSRLKLLILSPTPTDIPQPEQAPLKSV